MLRIPFHAWLVTLLLLATTGSVPARETNWWPFFVGQEDSPEGRPDHSGSLGPLFSSTLREGERILSIRPLWTSFQGRADGSYSHHLLYPLANWYDRGTVRNGNALGLVRYRRADPQEETFFEIFPFVFSNRTPDPASSYFALWPLGGTLKNRLWRDRIDFALWPLWVRTQLADETYHHFPYPFLRKLDGPRSSGFGFWPFYDHSERENDYHHTWILWPFYYHLLDDLDQEVPGERFGLWPFYHRETALGLKSHSWVWPFFGYTRETEPRVPYSENRYLWPFWMQGRGEERHLEWWLPLYGLDRQPGEEKRWYLWPLVKREAFSEPGMTRDRTTLLYFVYRDDRQRIGERELRKTTLWPLFAYWDNGLGQRQFQAFDPFSVFFPHNEKIRENWTPLFAVYRFDERSGSRRHSVLWDLLVWEGDQQGLNALYAGPLFEWERGSHWEILKGLVGSDTEETGPTMRFFWAR